MLSLYLFLQINSGLCIILPGSLLIYILCRCSHMQSFKHHHDHATKIWIHLTIHGESLSNLMWRISFTLRTIIPNLSLHLFYFIAIEFKSMNLGQWKNSWMVLVLDYFFKDMFQILQESWMIVAIFELYWYLLKGHAYRYRKISNLIAKINKCFV